MEIITNTIIYCAIGTVSIFGALTLLPLWIGMITSHPRKLRLTLVPALPFVVAAAFTNATIITLVVMAVEDDLFFEGGFLIRILGGIAGVAGYSAFALWIVTWALFKKWRRGD